MKHGGIKRETRRDKESENEGRTSGNFSASEEESEEVAEISHILLLVRMVYHHLHRKAE
jgi:hypothetical protein